VEKWIWQEVAGWSQDLKKIEDSLRQHPVARPNAETDAARLQEIEALAHRLTDRQRKLLASFGDADDDTSAMIATQVKQIGTERQALKFEIDTLRRKLNAPKVAQEDFLKTVERLRDVLRANPGRIAAELQREYLEALDIRVTVGRWEDRQWEPGAAFRT
jgi:hypothetical protein